MHSLWCNTLNFNEDMTRGKGQFLVEAISWYLYSHLLSAAVESSKFHQGALTITKRWWALKAQQLKLEKAGQILFTFQSTSILAIRRNRPKEKSFNALLKSSKTKLGHYVIISSYLLHLLDYNFIHTSLDVNGVRKRNVMKRNVML